MRLEELDGRFERALLSGLNLWVGHVSADSEAVRTSFKVLPAVQSRKLVASTKDSIRSSLGLDGELLVDFARVDQEGNARLLERL